MTAWKYIGGFSVTFAVVACFVTWLVLGEWSPFHDFFLDHVALPNMTRQLLIIPYVVLIMINPETEFGDSLVATTVEFLQWLAVGFLLALFVKFVSSGRQTDRTKWLE